MQGLIEDVYLPPDVVLDECQFYVHNVGFYLMHTLAWCRQLELSLDFLSNFNYSKQISATRADHLIFNMENYLIRLNSVYDRVLQITNAVFHLCVDEEHVGHAIIVSNYKVVHRPEIKAAIKALKKFLDGYSQTRHTLIHKHSYLDVGLRRIERLYMIDISLITDSKSRVSNLKAFRARYLSNFLKEKKKEFAGINEALAEHLRTVFTRLEPEYQRQKQALR